MDHISFLLTFSYLLENLQDLCSLQFQQDTSKFVLFCYRKQANKELILPESMIFMTWNWYSTLSASFSGYNIHSKPDG